MKPLLMIAAALCLFALAGCTSNRWRAQEAGAYYAAQKELATTRKPLFELRAQPGQTITLSGVESLTVNDPREIEIKALPQERHPAWQTIDKLLGIGAQVYGAKVVADGVTDLVSIVASNAGNHSVPTTNTAITGSYNTQGDTLTNSIGGDVRGDGAGVANTYTSRDTATTVTGDRNATGSTAGRDVNLGDGSASPRTRDDHSVRGDTCEGEQCQRRTPPPDQDDQRT